MAEFDIFNLGTDDVETHQKQSNVSNELYRPKAQDGQDGVYKAKIRFVPNPNNPKKSIIHKYVYWLEDSMGNGKLVDSPQSIGERCPIADVFWKLKKSESAVDRKASENLKRRHKYYSIVKILKDPQRPDLEGQYMIYNFGHKIKEKIDEEINPTWEDQEPTQVFDLFEGKDFELKITRQGEYNNYDKCQFSSERTPIIIDGRYAERSKEDQEKIKKELEQAPDLEQYEYKPWDDETKNFVNKVLNSYLKSSDVAGNMAEATSFNSNETKQEATTTKEVAGDINNSNNDPQPQSPQQSQPQQDQPQQDQPQSESENNDNSKVKSDDNDLDQFLNDLDI